MGDYYVSVGHELSYAGFLSSQLMIGALFLSPVVGSLTDRFGGEEYFILAGSAALAVLFWLVPKTGLPPLYLGILLALPRRACPHPCFRYCPILCRLRD